MKKTVRAGLHMPIERIAPLNMDEITDILIREVVKQIEVEIRDNPKLLSTEARTDIPLGERQYQVSIDLVTPELPVENIITELVNLFGDERAHDIVAELHATSIKPIDRKQEEDCLRTIIDLEKERRKEGYRRGGDFWSTLDTYESPSTIRRDIDAYLERSRKAIRDAEKELGPFKHRMMGEFVEKDLENSQEKHGL